MTTNNAAQRPGTAKKYSAFTNKWPEPSNNSDRAPKRRLQPAHHRLVAIAARFVATFNTARNNHETPNPN